MGKICVVVTRNHDCGEGGDGKRSVENLVAGINSIVLEGSVKIPAVHWQLFWVRTLVSGDDVRDAKTEGQAIRDTVADIHSQSVGADVPVIDFCRIEVVFVDETTLVRDVKICFAALGSPRPRLAKTWKRNCQGNNDDD